MAIYKVVLEKVSFVTADSVDEAREKALRCYTCGV